MNTANNLVCKLVKRERFFIPPNACEHFRLKCDITLS